jgi:hypothetical protein
MSRTRSHGNRSYLHLGAMHISNIASISVRLFAIEQNTPAYCFAWAYKGVVFGAEKNQIIRSVLYVNAVLLDHAVEASEMPSFLEVGFSIRHEGAYTNKVGSRNRPSILARNHIYRTLHDGLT